MRFMMRWVSALEGIGPVAGNGSPSATRPKPLHAFSSAELEQIRALVNEPRFAAISPTRIVPMLADGDVYVAS
jgi:putative transposase